MEAPRECFKCGRMCYFKHHLCGNRQCKFWYNRDGARAVAEQRYRRKWGLQRLGRDANEQLRRAAVRATKLPMATDNSVFTRFEELVIPLLAEEDPLLQTAIDEVLAAAVGTHEEAVAAFAKEHDRKLK